jgi:lipoyl(octanoyl) transferase
MIDLEWLGLQDYVVMREKQRLRRELIIRRTGTECIWALEHYPVITVGRRRVDDLPSSEELNAAGIDLCESERGGLATYHGPGQVVCYLLIDLVARQMKVREMMCGLEQGVIDWLGEHGVAAGRRSGYPGVWVGEAKICAIGMHFRRGVSMHGLALNLCNDDTGFDQITPCGIPGLEVTSLLKETGVEITPEDASMSLISKVMNALLLT